MSYFKTINYDNGVEGAIHFEPILNGENKMFLSIQFYKLNPDRTKRCLSCSQTFDANSIDQLIEKLNVAKQNILKYNNGDETILSQQDIQDEKQYQQFKDRFEKRTKSNLFDLFS